LNAPCAVKLSRIGTQLGFLDIDSLPVQLGMPNDRPPFAVNIPIRTERFISGVLGPQQSAILSPKAKPPTGLHFVQCPAGGLKRPQIPCTEAVLLGRLLWQTRTPPKTHNAPKLNNAWWRCTRTENCNPLVPLCRPRPSQGSTKNPPDGDRGAGTDASDRLCGRTNLRIKILGYWRGWRSHPRSQKPPSVDR
jgi:hypothetical protein